MPTTTEKSSARKPTESHTRQTTLYTPLGLITPRSAGMTNQHWKNVRDAIPPWGNKPGIWKHCLYEECKLKMKRFKTKYYDHVKRYHTVDEDKYTIAHIDLVQCI